MAKAARRGGHARDPGPGQSEADRIIDSALGLIPTEGWQSLSLAAIAAAAELPILRVYRTFRSKHAILCGFSHRVDQIILAEPPVAEPGERPRDRLFDLMMRRFDALQPYKPALDVLRRELATNPVTTLGAGVALLRSIRWMLEAADIPTGGMRGAVTVKLATAAYLSAMRVWQRDNSPDLARTMAALDSRLRRIERWLPQTRTRRTDGEPVPA